MRLALLLLARVIADFVISSDLSESAATPVEILLNGKKGLLQITGEPDGLCDPDVKQFSGYFELNEGDKRYFFWFFEARQQPQNASTVMWLTGGPGCSSQLALLVENGPCSVDKDGKNTVYNKYSWNSEANIFWVDQPPGTGFSEGEYDHDEAGVAQDMYHFLLALFTKYPQYNRNFFVFGESYAGHYIPAVTHKIFDMNKQVELVIDLKGMGIGNGLTDAEEQYKWYPDMAYKSGTAPSVISADEYAQMQMAVPACVQAIKICNDETTFTCNLAMFICNMGLFGPYQQKGLNPYDMRLKCENPPLCYPFENVGKFLNDPEVQRKLGVNKQWEECNMMVNLFFQQDFMRNFHQLIPEMLHSGIRVLIYAGDVDYICNWLGNKHWTLELEWEGKEGFNEAKDKAYKTNEGKDVGMVRSHKGFTFLQVYQAGHMVPMDKPEESLFMFNEFLAGRLGNETQQVEKLEI